MDIYLFSLVLIGFMALYLMLGIYAARHVHTVQDYFLAGRKLGIPSVTLALLATQIGGGMLLGTAQEAYATGLFGLMYNCGMVCGFLLLGLGVAGRLRALNVATTAELFETRYNSPLLKKCASLLSVITLCGILVSQIVGFRALLIGLGVHHELIFLLFWFFVILHTMHGGLQSIITTDIYQVVFILIIFVSILFYCVQAEAIPLIEMLVTAQNTVFAHNSFSRAQVIPTFIMPALFSLIEQDLAQRFFASRTRAVASISALCAGIFLILFSLVPVYFGVKARLLGLSIAQGSSSLMPAIGVLTNDFVLILATCAVIAAICSTADALLCAISSNLVQDFGTGEVGASEQLKESKIVTGIVGIVALLASYVVPKNIIDILIASYAVSVGCLFVPLFVSYYYSNVKRGAAYAGVIGGVISFICSPWIHTAFPKELVPLIVSGISYLVAHLVF